jgi:signal transduction histidine kinase
VGIRNLANTKLVQALRGELAVSAEAMIWDILPAEQRRVPPGTQYFSEMYMPIWNLERNAVIGVVEVYKASDTLFQTISRGQQLIWGGALGGGLLLYGLLLGIIQRASRVIQQQREQLLATDTLVAMGEMAAVMAHNIRTPLATIRSAVEVVLEDQTAQPLLPQAEDIIAELDKLQGWLYDLLNHARPLAAVPTPVPLATVLHHAVDHFATTLPAQGVALQIDAPASLPLIQADATLLQQVLHTVIANAADAMPQGGALTIQAVCTPDQQHVQVRVRDTGHGMSQETAAKVFQPFFTTKRQGLGIGLALARRMIERYGGTITLSSAEGSGTTVTVQLPIAA